VIAELRQQFSLPLLLEFAGMARSSFYYQLKSAKASDRYCAAKKRIRSIFERHKGRYGYRRITLAVRKTGILINHKTVQRLMGELNLKSLVRPKKYRSYRGEVGKAAQNILQREFEATQPNQKWVTDVTEFKVAGEKLYLSPVMDLYNGEIIAFETSKRPSFAMVNGMLRKALARLKGNDRPLLHSDSNNVDAGFPPGRYLI
jgi:putative transposase